MASLGAVLLVPENRNVLSSILFEPRTEALKLVPLYSASILTWIFFPASALESVPSIVQTLTSPARVLHVVSN